MTILQLAEKIQEQVPNAVLKISESTFQDARNYAVSSEKAQRELGFKPQWNVSEGIAEIATAVREFRIPDVNVARFSNVAALKGQLGVK